MIIKKQDLPILIPLFLFTSAAVSFSLFLFNFDETPVESELSSLLAGNIVAILTLTYAQLFTIPSIVVSIGISKILALVNHMSISPLVAGFLASIIFLGISQLTTYVSSRKIGNISA